MDLYHLSITYLSVVTIVLLLLIESKVELSYFAAPLLCFEGFAVITHKYMSPSLTLYTDKTHKVNIKSKRENGLIALLCN